MTEHIHEPLRFAQRNGEYALKHRRRIGRSITAILAVVLLGLMGGAMASAFGQLISRGL